MTITKDYLELKKSMFYGPSSQWELHFINQNVDPVTATGAQLNNASIFSQSITRTFVPGNPEIFQFGAESANTANLTNIYVLALKEIGSLNIFVHAWAINGGPITVNPNTEYNFFIRLDR
jgi:hypothetical protein